MSFFWNSIGAYIIVNIFDVREELWEYPIEILDLNLLKFRQISGIWNHYPCCSNFVTNKKRFWFDYKEFQKHFRKDDSGIQLLIGQNHMKLEHLWYSEL